jgi:hypothetical protein
MCKQTFYHFWRPLPLFLVYVTIFCKVDLHSVMEIDVSLAQSLVSFVAYWKHLDITCLQQLPMNGVVNPNTSQEITKIRAMFIVIRLLPLSFTYVKILAFNHMLLTPCSFV